MARTRIQNSILFGLLNHLGPSVGFCIVVNIYDFAWLPSLCAFIGFSFLSLISLLWSEWKFPRDQLKTISRRQIIEGMSLIFAKGALIGSMVIVTGYFILQNFFGFHIHQPNWIRIFFAVALTDLAYYFIHRFLNHGRGSDWLHRWYRHNHAMHHSVEALDFFRGNLSSLIDTAITGFQIPLIFIGAALNLSLEAQLITYGLVLLLQGTHHVNHSFNIGYLNWIFVDNDNHRVHHGKRGCFFNYGAVFSIWDRIFRTLSCS